MRSCAATSGSCYALLTGSIGRGPPVKPFPKSFPSMSCCALPAWPLLVVAAELLSLHAFDPKRELFRIIEISQNVPMHGAMMYLASGVTAAQPHREPIPLIFFLSPPIITGLRRDV